MKCIRSQIFETNSSSTHGIVMMKDMGWTDKEHVRRVLGLYCGGDFRICLGRYSWGPSVITGFAEKLDYIVTLIASNIKGCDDLKQAKLEAAIKKTRWFKKVMKSICQYISLPLAELPEPVIDMPNGYLRWYIDHDSVVKVEHFLKDVELSDYLFNDKVFVKIDSDNNDPKDFSRIAYNHFMEEK